MSSYKFLFVTSGLTCLIGFIGGYFIGSSDKDIIPLKLDNWYVFDTCLGNCLICEISRTEKKSDVPLSESLKSDNSRENKVISQAIEILPDAESEKILEDPDSLNLTELYFAKLAGFSSLKRAQAYLKDLKRRGIETRLKTHYWKPRKTNKIREWYQIITAPLSFEETKKIVEKITAEDHLTQTSICLYTDK